MRNDQNFSKRFFRGSDFECCLAVLKPDECFTLYGIFSVRVLCGAVCIRGRLLNIADKEPVLVAAPYLLGPPVNIHSGPRVECELEHQRVMRRVKKVAEDPNAVFQEFNIGDNLLLFWFKDYNIASIISGLYGPVFFTPSFVDNARDGYKLSSFSSILNVASYPPLFGEAFGRNIESLIESINHRRDSGKKPKVVITGPKGVGKSTVARSLLTMLFEKDGRPIYLLDCDVGQAECTPPGCVSLCKINSPVLDASFNTQQATFKNCYFFGSVTPSSDPDLYMALILQLIEEFAIESEPQATLVVNTCGWVEERGCEILDFIISSLAPDFIFNIDSLGAINYKGEGLQRRPDGKKAKIFMCTAEAKNSAELNLPANLTAAARRDLLTTGYFVNNMPLTSIPAFADISPLAVMFKPISLYIHPSLGLVPDTHIFAALNCTLVALCSASNDEIKRSHRILNKDDMPYLIDEESVKLRCWGFGFIRAIDVEKRYFYMLTPVERDALRRVNVFARGINIDLPSYFLTQQHSKDPPYVVSIERSSLQSGMYKELRVSSTFKRTHKKRPS